MQPRPPAPSGPPGEPTAETPGAVLARTRAAVAPLDAAATAAARDRLDGLAKPRKALGVLEDVAVQLSGLARACPPPLPEPATVAVFAADHGVHARGVTPWPQEVTAQMVATFLSGRAAVNTFAAQTGAQVLVVDVGVAGPVPHSGAEAAVRRGFLDHDGVRSGGAVGGRRGFLDHGDEGEGRRSPVLVDRRVRSGTADLSAGPAMRREEAVAAVEVGIEVATRLVRGGSRCLLTGDMGIANTTASAALVAAFTGADPQGVTGRGTGIDDATLRRKTQVVRAALVLHDGAVRRAAEDPLGVLAAVGGLEHAALAGFVLAASAHRVPVVLDGVIAGAAALVAAALAPDVTGACVAGHRSAEPGHAVALAALGLRPLVELDLRLGEGTGAVLALPLVQAAVRALRDMATLDDAVGAGAGAGAEAVAVAPAGRQ